MLSLKAYKIGNPIYLKWSACNSERVCVKAQVLEIILLFL